mmetsp:Transcript_2989/g.10192  ORF Transcript_2989/g.10192 Transcript_2989/m.10192 type:complete len:387 (+) Transcript_2989:395-1555(+)
MAIPGTNVTVFYGMQKTCDFSGREFYALGTYENASFALLDVRSDYASNVFDGGEGYAAMHLYDAAKDRLVWIPAVIEADRDPCAADHGSGFWEDWAMTRAIGSGWFGTLGLPREVWLADDSAFLPGPARYLRTPPLPELAGLAVGPTERAAGVALDAAAPFSAALAGASLRATAVFEDLDPGFDVGLVVLKRGDEFTRVGLRDASLLQDVDLWDETNGDSASFANSTLARCRGACGADASCAAWTFTAGGLCRFKAFAATALQMPCGRHAPAFEPFRNGSTSGFKAAAASLYVDRSNSTRDAAAPAFAYAKTLFLPPGAARLKLDVFLDGSILEAFADEGRAVVTARLYPTQPDANELGAYAAAPATLASFEAVALGPARLAAPPL